jgi:hypothetical protein
MLLNNAVGCDLHLTLDGHVCTGRSALASSLLGSTMGHMPVDPAPFAAPPTVSYVSSILLTPSVYIARLYACCLGHLKATYPCGLTDLMCGCLLAGCLPGLGDASQPSRARLGQDAPKAGRPLSKPTPTSSSPLCRRRLALGRYRVKAVWNQACRERWLLEMLQSEISRIS